VNKIDNQPTRPDFVTDEMLEYMDNIRVGGSINPLAAGPEVRNEFGLTRYEARDMISYWAKTFGKGSR